MGWEGWLTLAVIGLCLVALVRNLASPDIVLLGGVAALLVASPFTDRLPGPRQVASSFGNEALLTVAVLFVVAEGLTHTGGMSVLTARLLGRPRTVASAQLRLMLPVTFFSAFLNNTPVVALFMPVVNDWCKKQGFAPSKLFLPLSYAAVLGGTCTLIGTSTNLVVQGLLADAGLPKMGMFTLSAVGVPAAVLGAIYVVLASRRLLPDRGLPSASSGDPREYTVEMMVEPGSELAGRTIEDAGLRHLPGVYLMEIERDGESLVAVGSDQVLRAGDRLVFVGVVDSVVDLHKRRGLRPATDQVFKLTEPRRNRVLVEAVVSPSHPLVGKTIRDGRFRTRYDAAVIAVHRGAERVPGKIGDIVLSAGDTLLLESHPSFLERHRNSRDFFLVSGVRDSEPRRHERAWVAIAILAAMAVAMGLEGVTGLSVLTVASVAAALMIATGCISLERARASLDWSTLLAIGAGFGLGRAAETSGAAQLVGTLLVDGFRPFGPYGVLLGVYLTTLVFTEIVTNNAAAVLAFPIARAAAQALGVSFLPFAVVVAIAASAGFAMPMGYQTHLMVLGPGGYRPSDFLRIGLPLDLLVLLVTLLLAPVVFPFR